MLSYMTYITLISEKFSTSFSCENNKKNRNVLTLKRKLLFSEYGIQTSSEVTSKQKERRSTNCIHKGRGVM